MTARVFRLTQMHQRIDQRLRAEVRKLWPDWFEVARLKRTKLRIKDALHRLAMRRRTA